MNEMVTTFPAKEKKNQKIDYRHVLFTWMYIFVFILICGQLFFSHSIINIVGVKNVILMKKLDKMEAYFFIFLYFYILAAKVE